MKHLLLFLVFLCGLPLSAKDVVVHLTDSRNAPLSYLMVSTTNQTQDEQNTYYYADRDGYITLPLTEPGASVNLYLRQYRRPRTLASATWDGVADTLEIQTQKPYTTVFIPASNPDFLDLFRLETYQNNFFNSIYFYKESEHYTEYESDPYNCYYSNELKGIVTYIQNCPQDTLYPFMESNSLIDWGNQNYNPGAIVRDTLRNLFKVNITDELSLAKLNLCDFDRNLISNWFIDQVSIETTYNHAFRRNTNYEFNIEVKNTPFQFICNLQTGNQETYEKTIEIKDYYNRLKILLRDHENNLLNGWICNGDTATNGTVTFFSPKDIKNYNLSFSQDHYMPWERTCIIKGNDEEYEYDLKESYPVTLKFIDSYGTPMANQAFTAYTASHPYEIKTDDAGTYSFNLNEPVCLIEDITFNNTLFSNRILIESVQGNPIYKEVVMKEYQTPQNLFYFKYKNDFTDLDYKDLFVNCNITIYEEHPDGLIRPCMTDPQNTNIPYFPEFFLKDRKYWVVFHNQGVYKFVNRKNELISNSIAPRMIPLDISHVETVDGKNYVYLSNLLEEYRILEVSRDTSTFATFEMKLSLPGVLEYQKDLESKFYNHDTIYIAPNTYNLKSLNLITKDLARYPIDIPNPTFTIEDDTTLDYSGVQAVKETADLNICIKNELGEPIKGVIAYYNSTEGDELSLSAVTDESGMASFKNQRPDSVTLYFNGSEAGAINPYKLRLNPGDNNREIVVHGLFNSEIELTGSENKRIELYSASGKRITNLKETIFKDSIYFSYHIVDYDTNIQYLGTVHSAPKEKITLNLDELSGHRMYVNQVTNITAANFAFGIYFWNGDVLCLAPGTYYFDGTLKATIDEEDNFNSLSELFEHKFRKINYLDGRYTSIYIDDIYYTQYCDLPPGIYHYTYTETEVIAGTLEIKEKEKEIDVYTPKLYDVYLYCIDQNGNPIQYGNNNGYTLTITNLKNGSIGTTREKEFHFIFSEGTYLIYPISDNFRAQPIKITVDGRQNTWAIPVETGSYFSATIRVTDSDGQPIAGASVSLNGATALSTTNNGMVTCGGFPYAIGEAELTVSAPGFDTRVVKIPLEEIYYINPYGSRTLNVILEKTTSIEDQTVGQEMSIHLQSNGFTVNSNRNDLIKYELYDLQGRKITEGKTLPANPIRLEVLSRGVYIIRCTQGANHAAVKFVSNN